MVDDGKYAGCRSVTEYFLKVDGLLRRLPPGRNIAINVSSYSNSMYLVSVGARIWDGFKSVSQGLPEFLLDGDSLESVASRELAPFGVKEKVFDVFINDELVRPADYKGVRK
jgi:hypothetical protein